MPHPSVHIIMSNLANICSEKKQFCVRLNTRVNWPIIKCKCR